MPARMLRGNGPGQKKEPFMYCWWESKILQPVWKSVWRFLKEVKIELPYDSSIALLGVHLEECKSAYTRDTCIPMFIKVLFTMAILPKSA
jgi:hypothetical protein